MAIHVLDIHEQERIRQLRQAALRIGQMCDSALWYDDEATLKRRLQEIAQKAGKAAK